MIDFGTSTSYCITIGSDLWNFNFFFLIMILNEKKGIIMCFLTFFLKKKDICTIFYQYKLIFLLQIYRLCKWGCMAGIFLGCVCSWRWPRIPSNITNCCLLRRFSHNYYASKHQIAEDHFPIFDRRFIQMAKVTVRRPKLLMNKMSPF